MECELVALSFKKADPFEPQISQLIDDLDAYQAPLYPDESNHLESRENLRSATFLFFALYEDETPIGIGALKLQGDYAEIKRVYICPEKRGQGYGRQMMEKLEEEGRALNLGSLKLETGIYQKSAIEMYKKMGYEVIAAFGDYLEDPLSLFMNKKIL